MKNKEILKDFIKTKLRTKKGVYCLTLIMMTLVLGLSYGAFVITSSKYKASEMLISELMYGITITEDGGNVVGSNSVTVPANSSKYYFITISSLSEIESKYTLGYKANTNVSVKYTDKTQWTPEGVITGYKSDNHTRTVRVVIENKTEESQEVSFKVYGGYTFRTYAEIELKDGYKSITEKYKEIVASTNETLTELVKENANCTKEECYYSGGSISNYLQYPEDIDKTKNLWRIIGTKTIGKEEVTKLISETRVETTRSNIPESLTEIYNKLDNQDTTIYKTKMFNCNSSGCTESEYENIGLISEYEYNTIGGSTSYLKAENPYFALDNSTIKNITRSSIEETTNETKSGIRPSIYLPSNTKVKGSGTESDPYVIVKGNDLNLMAVKLDGEETKLDYNTLKETNGYPIKSIECSNNVTASWDPVKDKIIVDNNNLPTNCTLDFASDYATVNLNVTNGTVRGKTTVKVAKGTTYSFDVNPDDGYALDSESTLECNGNNCAVSDHQVNFTANTSGTVAVNLTKALSPYLKDGKLVFVNYNTPNTSYTPSCYGRMIWIEGSGRFRLSKMIGDSQITLSQKLTCYVNGICKALSPIANSNNDIYDASECD